LTVDSVPVNEDDTPPPEPPADAPPVCPVCGAPLIAEKCKLVCRSAACVYRIVFNCSEF
jgi:hypothetical protein